MASQMVYFESRDQAMSRILPDKRRAARAELKKLKDLAENFYVSATLPSQSTCHLSQPERVPEIPSVDQCQSECNPARARARARVRASTPQWVSARTRARARARAT